MRKRAPARKRFKAIWGIPEPTWSPCLESVGMLPPLWLEDAEQTGEG